MDDVEPLVSETEIARRVDSLAEEITAAISGPFLIVALLKGSFVFAADLLRALHRQGRSPTIDFLRLGSYGLEKESSGDVRLLADVETDLTGQTILLLDDIADTGRSLVFAREILSIRGCGPISICALLDKPSRREVAVEIDFVGFSIEDLFVAGYGIDYAERYRHLPYIGVVK